MLKFHQDVRLRIGDVIVQYRLINKDTPVVITFPPGSEWITEQETNEQVKLWGFDFFKKQQINVISFIHTGQDDYFRSIELQNFIKQLGKFIAMFPDKIGYGSSRGGFAVSLHANALGLDRALLLMPLSTYSSELAPWDPKVIKVDKATKYSGYNKDASGCKIPLTIIYDPLNKSDRLHVKRYSCQIQKLKFPGIGHRIARGLRDLGLLKKVVIDFVHDELDVDDFPRLIRNRRNLSYYHKGMSSNATGKLTLRRKKVIYYHKLMWKLKHIEDEPRKMATKLRDSLLKRIDESQKFLTGSKNFLPAKTFVMANFFIFC
ncbi:hypothetical protein MK852_07455 [Shewanella benthica]|uniref:hypothetical protein n=1 Tax=Shewanella benthica TaxID=43661 RepID=UPI0018798620|nr:hypothetical protein [Shewanella benthica]MBE7215040.1 hypothetical protein [Shewanella benthica]MCL1061968.1 hypothetical protein [Shewanella benthica]